MFTILSVLLLVVLYGGTRLISHVLTLNYTRQGEAITATVTTTSEGEANVSYTWAVAPSDKQLNLVFDVANVKSVYIKSTKAATLETNATDHTGGDIITLAADLPVIWYEGCGWENPFVEDVTTAYLTSAIATGSIDIRILLDATP